MAIFVCPECKSTQDAPDPYIGRTSKCLKCGALGRVAEDRSIPQTPSSPNRRSDSPAQHDPGRKLRPITKSPVAHFLTVVAVIELVVALLGGFAVGSQDGLTGWCVFLCGVVSGSILLGFASVVESTSETAQRLQRMEMLIRRERDGESS